jgi:hypothetical protein
LSGDRAAVSGGGWKRVMATGLNNQHRGLERSLILLSMA